jgi:hypothetical protein
LQGKAWYDGFDSGEGNGQIADLIRRFFMKRTVTMLFCVALLLLLFTYRGKSIRVTICDLNEAGDMVVMSEDRQNTYVVNDCARYIQTGEELHIGDIVKIFYRGNIQETSPATIKGIRQISVIDRISLQ